VKERRVNTQKTGLKDEKNVSGKATDSNFLFGLPDGGKLRIASIPAFAE